MMGIPGAYVHKMLSRVPHSLLRQPVVTATCAAQCCLNTNTYSVGMEGKFTLEWSSANNMGTDWGVVLIANTILLLLRQPRACVRAWAAGRKRKLSGKPMFCKRTKIFVPYYFVLARILMNATKTILWPTGFGNLLIDYQRTE